MSNTAIGNSLQRKEAWDKVTGQAKYTADQTGPGLLYARLLLSPLAHGLIQSIDISAATQIEGVLAVILGKDTPQLTGALIEDRPILAINCVRYYGEPVAMVVALDERTAARAASCIKVSYAPLPVIQSPKDALTPQAPKLHPAGQTYKKLVEDIYPQTEMNIASRYYIRKGNIEQGWIHSQVIAEENFSLPGSDHICLETRIAEAELKADGTFHIRTSAQAPFTVKKLVASYFNMEVGQVQVQVPLLGGGFGGKACVQLELLACLAARAVGSGRRVRLSNSREADLAASPRRLGLEASIKLGAASDGRLQAAAMTFWLDCGAYADTCPYMSKAIAVDCSGPYYIPNLNCDSICAYTNHSFATSFRGFAHESYTFCLERTLDALARRLGMDPYELRLINAIKPGQTTPTQVTATASNMGNMTACLQKLKTLINWGEGDRQQLGPHLVKAKGISGLWKTPNPPTNAAAGALLTFNTDGSLNLNTGVIEMGSGSQTQLAQILAERLKMSAHRINVKLDTDTFLSPYYWKTVASMTCFLAGRAVLKAADDLISQLKTQAALVFKCDADDLAVAQERVYLKHDPATFLTFSDLAFGYTDAQGQACGNYLLGRGSHMFKRLKPLDPLTGQGNPGNAWSVGAQAVEIEVNTREYTYRLLRAATVLDVGCLINPAITTGSLMGGMSMGLSLASREAFTYDKSGILETTSLRNYKLMHIGQEPLYLVDFVETPQLDAPYGTRAYSEHGIIGMPAALGNALSTALQTELNHLPLTPENLWSHCRSHCTKQGDTNHECAKQGVIKQVGTKQGGQL